MWFVLWFVLVAATLVGAFFLGRDLFRKGHRLLLELERAGTLIEDMGERLEREPTIGTRSPGPSVAADRVQLVTRVAATRKARADRKRRASRRHAVIYRHWKVLNGMADGPVTRSGTR